MQGLSGIVMVEIASEILRKKLEDLLTDLLDECGAGRCTVRIDDPQRGWSVDLVCAEAVRPGVNSLLGNGSIDQRAAETVKWMTANKRSLIQPDITNNPDPAPPPALMSAYAAKAQMLGPLLTANGYLQGWISVHYVDHPRPFTDKELHALERARQTAAKLVGLKGPS